MNEETTREDIITNEEKVMLILFGSDKETLNQARAEQNHRRVANATVFVSPYKFPPTSVAAAQNSL